MSVEVPIFPTGSRIPRVIHQVYISRNPLPAVLAQNVERIKAMNPGWVHRLYDEEAVTAFIVEHYGETMLGVFRKINPRYGAARADFFRYLLLYKCGGVYLDIKSSTEKPLDECIHPDDAFVLSCWRNGPGEPFEGFGVQREFGPDRKRELQQWHILAAPGHPFLRAVIARVARNIETYRPWTTGVGNKGVCRVTGPIAYTLAIEPLMATNKHRKVADETAISLIYSVYKNRDAHQGVFGRYYGHLSDSIVQLRGWRHLAGRLYSTGRNALIVLRSLFRQTRGIISEVDLGDRPVTTYQSQARHD